MLWSRRRWMGRRNAESLAGTRLRGVIVLDAFGRATNSVPLPPLFSITGGKQRLIDSVDV
jgi:hypothetical protein